MTLVLVALLAVAATGVVGLLAWGTLRTLRRQQERLGASNEVVPGVPTSAPVAWAGSHDPEARLHRRLRDAMTALRSAPAAMDGAGVELRVELEQQALALDDALVAIAAASVTHRRPPLARVEGAVAQLEQAVADVAAASADAAASRLEAVVADVHRQRVTLEEIRAELDGPSALDALADSGGASEPGPAPLSTPPAAPAASPDQAPGEAPGGQAPPEVPPAS